MSAYTKLFCAGGCGRTATLRARDTKVWLCDSCGRATRSATAQAGRLLRNGREAAVPGARTAQTPMPFQHISRPISRMAGNAVARKLTALIPSRSSLWRVWVQRCRQIAGDAARRRGRGQSSVPTALITTGFGRARNLTALMLCGLLLAACDTGIRADADLGVREGQQLTAAQRDLLRAQMDGRAHREERPFYGAAVQVERGKVSGKPLPKAVEGARGIALRLAGQADIKSIAAAITASTNIPVNIRTRYVLEDGVVDVPIGTRMSATYEGPLSAFLDRLGARMDVGWSHDGTVITIDRMVRRTWRIALPLGTTNITDTSETQRGPSIITTREVDPWGDLERRLKPLAPAPARVTLTAEAGRVEVFGPPSVQKAVGAVLEEVAATANARIGLEVAVYFVDADKVDTFGISADITGRLGDISGNLLAAASGDAGDGLILSRGADRILFEALARDSAVVDYRLASAVAQSGVITPIAITEERSYIRNVTIEAGEGDNPPTTTYEIGEMESGMAIAALPRLIEGRRIHLALTLTQRAFRGFDADVLERTGTVQAPTIDNREIRNQTVLSPGETLVLSGYEQDVTSRGDSGLGIFRRIGLGGKTEAARTKVRLIVLVRPTLIPARRDGS